LGHVRVVEWLIASGKDFGNVHEQQGFSAHEVARKREKTEVVSLLERFMADPTQTRYELRVKLGVLDELAAELFALTVFHCDNLLQLKPDLATNPAAVDAAAIRFFVIARRMPVELQMVLCNRAVGSGKDSVLTSHSERAFKDLARILLGSGAK